MFRTIYGVDFSGAKLAGLLALGSIVLILGGFALVMAHGAGQLGLWLMGAGLGSAIAGWIVLGAPLNRRNPRLAVRRGRKHNLTAS